MRINLARTEQALAVGPDIISSACPYCLTMMEDGAKLADRDDVGTKDVAEILSLSVFGNATESQHEEQEVVYP